jgi:hypothetical protein
MALEALVGGKNFHLHLDSMLAPGSLSLTTVLLSQMFPTGTVTWKLLGTAWWRQQAMVIPKASKLPSRWS